MFSLRAYKCALEASPWCRMEKKIKKMDGPLSRASQPAVFMPPWFPKFLNQNLDIQVIMKVYLSRQKERKYFIYFLLFYYIIEVLVIVLFKKHILILYDILTSSNLV